MTALPKAWSRTAPAPAPRAARPANLVRALDLAERLALLIAIFLSLAANLASHRVLNVASLGTDLLVAGLMLVRAPAQRISRTPGDWLLAFGAGLGVLLMRPGGTPLIGDPWALALALPGWLIALAALVSLNRAFGIVPADRGIRTGGAYAVVRHPMYLGYALTHTAYLLLNPTGLNLAVWTFVGGCQIGRILSEERLLRGDPAYRAYSAGVRFRLIPGLF